MSSPRSGYYIFNKNLAAFATWRKKFLGLRAVWVDSAAKAAQGFRQELAEGVLVVEEGLLPHLKRSAELPSKEQTFVQEATSQPADDRTLKVCLLPSNDTHVATFGRLLGQDLKLEFRVFPDERENVKDALRALGQDFTEFSGSEDFDVLLLGNDWGWPEKAAIAMFKKANRPSICLQESVLNFGDITRRMEWADAAFIQGTATLKSLKRQVSFLTGNPRYEKLNTLAPVEGPVLINCNFTYGIWEEQRMSWIEAAVRACGQAGRDYLIVQHPRDTGDLQGFNFQRTTAANIQNLIAQSACVVTRFSSLVHEALALGRPVVYYNPHGEVYGYDFEFDQKHLVLARSEAELNHALSGQERLAENDPVWAQYAWRHSAAVDGEASARVCEALRVVAQAGRRPLRTASEDVQWDVRYQPRRLARRLMRR